MASDDDGSEEQHTRRMLAADGLLALSQGAVVHQPATQQASAALPTTLAQPGLQTAGVAMPVPQANQQQGAQEQEQQRDEQHQENEEITGQRGSTEVKNESASPIQSQGPDIKQERLERRSLNDAHSGHQDPQVQPDVLPASHEAHPQEELSPNVKQETPMATGGTGIGKSPQTPQHSHTAMNGSKFNIFTSLLSQPELMHEVTAQLDLDDLISLYAISKEFHVMVNSRFTSMILAQANSRFPESAKIFHFKCYRSLCIFDPMRLPHPRRVDVYRNIPGFRWLRMLEHRERVVDEILTSLAIEGHRLPPRAPRILKQIWFMMDMPDSARRIGYAHNRSFFSDVDLYVASMFFVKLDMRLQDPVDGMGALGLRKMLLAQRSLYPLDRVLRRRALLDRFDMLRMWLEWEFIPPPLWESPPPPAPPAPPPAPQGGTAPQAPPPPPPPRLVREVFSVPLQFCGRMQCENWVRTPQPRRLLRPDEVIVREVVRRNLPYAGMVHDMILYGNIDPITGRDIQALPPRTRRRVAELDKIDRDHKKLTLHGGRFAKAQLAAAQLEEMRRQRRETQDQAERVRIMNEMLENRPVAPRMRAAALAWVHLHRATEMEMLRRGVVPNAGMAAATAAATLASRVPAPGVPAGGGRGRGAPARVGAAVGTTAATAPVYGGPVLVDPARAAFIRAVNAGGRVHLPAAPALNDPSLNGPAPSTPARNAPAQAALPIVRQGQLVGQVQGGGQPGRGRGRGQPEAQTAFANYRRLATSFLIPPFLPDPTAPVPPPRRPAPRAQPPRGPAPDPRHFPDTSRSHREDHPAWPVSVAPRFEADRADENDTSRVHARGAGNLYSPNSMFGAIARLAISRGGAQEEWEAAETAAAEAANAARTAAAAAAATTTTTTTMANGGGLGSGAGAGGGGSGGTV